jgi:hypothetical protein
MPRPPRQRRPRLKRSDGKPVKAGPPLTEAVRPGPPRIEVVGPAAESALRTLTEWAGINVDRPDSAEMLRLLRERPSFPPMLSPIERATVDVLRSLVEKHPSLPGALPSEETAPQPEPTPAPTSAQPSPALEPSPRSLPDAYKIIARRYPDSKTWTRPEIPRLDAEREAERLLGKSGLTPRYHQMSRRAACWPTY